MIAEAVDMNGSGVNGNEGQQWWRWQWLLTADNGWSAAITMAAISVGRKRVGVWLA